jgi:hypothetical protein
MPMTNALLGDIRRNPPRIFANAGIKYLDRYLSLRSTPLPS